MKQYKVSRKGPTLASLKQHLERMGKVKIGIVGEGARTEHEGGINMAALAAIHEYGAPAAGIPERAPIRNALAANKQVYRQMVAWLAGRVMRKLIAPERALELLGIRASADVKLYIKSGSALPANTPEVFLRKLMRGKRGFNKTGKAPVPLVDRGQLLNAYTYEVVPK